jgi:glycerol kinase
MADLLMAIDQGTTGTTVLVLDPTLRILGRVNTEFPQIFPRPGWVEHAPEAIWASTEQTIRGALSEAGVAGTDIAAIGITNQRETTVLWSRRDGQPIHNAIVWQCRRTAPRCEALRAEGVEGLVRKRTGLVLDAYFSGTKIEWLLDHVEGARARAEAGELAFGTIDTFLLWRLSGGEVHATEVSNASRTLLMRLSDGQWDEELCSLLRVPMSVLPEIRPNAGAFGHTRGVAGLPDGIPITGVAGDQQAALFGQCCFRVGEAKCTYGTGAFLLMNIGQEPLASKHRLLTTAAWRLGDEMTYAFEGSVFIAGAAVQWLRDGLGIIRTAAEIETLAASVPDTGGVVFVPALTGLGAPHWNPNARGVLWGMTRGTTAAHIARAALEGIAFQSYDILQAMERDLDEPLRALKVDGGASANDLLMQFQADLLDVPLVRPQILETTALGAAMLAGIGAGIYRGLDDVRHAWREDRRFDPEVGAETREAHLARWREGLARV